MPKINRDYFRQAFAQIIEVDPTKVEFPDAETGIFNGYLHSNKDAIAMKAAGIRTPVDYQVNLARANFVPEVGVRMFIYHDDVTPTPYYVHGAVETMPGACLFTVFVARRMPEPALTS